MTNLRPWFASDIAALIKSLLFTARDNESAEYRRGFLACAVALCVALGIDPQAITPKVGDK